MSAIRMLKSTLAGTAKALLFVTVLGGAAQARPAWFGPGSGPISPYKNYKGFKQVPPQPTAGQRRTAPTSQVPPQIRCVPNVGLVGANGVCPD